MKSILPDPTLTSQPGPLNIDVCDLRTRNQGERSVKLYRLTLSVTVESTMGRANHTQIWGLFYTVSGILHGGDGTNPLRTNLRFDWTSVSRDVRRNPRVWRKMAAFPPPGMIVARKKVSPGKLFLPILYFTAAYLDGDTMLHIFTNF